MKLFALFILPIFLYASSLESLVDHAKSSHLSLEAIKHKLSSFDEKYEISRNFANPELSLSMSDIQFGDITNRSIEPMQYTALNFKQKIPYFGKRDADSKKISAQKAQVNMSLEDAKVELVKAIKLTAYNIWEIEEQLKIIDEYIALTKKNIELFSTYNTSGASAHMSIMNAELTLSELKIKKSKLSSKRSGAYKIINYLSDMDNITTIEIDMSMRKPQNISYFLDSLGSNKAYKTKEAELNVAYADVKVQELKSYVDPVVQVGYFHRDNFDDYLSIGVGFSLPIYSTESYEQEVSRKTVLSKKSEVDNLKNKLSSQILAIYAQLKSSYEIYTILHEESLPQLEHMQQLSSSSIKTGADLFLYIQILEKKLSLDDQNIDAIASYHKNLALLEALIGEEK
jgi:outer membrane protein TolC